MTFLKFCKSCQTLLDTAPITEGDTPAVKLNCTNCGITEDVESVHTMHSNTYKTTGTTLKLSNAALYDPAVKRSSRITCTVADCPANDPSKWGTLTDKNIRVQPEVMIINYNDANRVSTYICRTCGVTFKHDSASVKPLK